MRPTQRVELIDKIAKKLQSRYTFSDIDTFLSTYKIKHPSNSPSFYSKRVYTKEALAEVDNNIIIDLAAELNISSSSSGQEIMSPPKMWEDTKNFKLFISHLAIHKDKATKLKKALEQYHIASFVAHEDINPTLLWQSEIERALNTMDAMICVHTKGFSESPWTQQEIGFGIGKNIKIMSLRMDEDPKGFISKHQAILRRGRDASGVAEEINAILINDFMTRDRMNEVRSNFQTKDDDEIPF